MFHQIKPNKTMKKMIQWVLVATLICGASVFTACSSNDDNPATPDLNLSEKIIGKWIVADINGQPALTNRKIVFTFVSTTKAYMSASLNRFSEVGSHWIDQLETDVVINGNKMTLTNHPVEHTTVVEEYNITAINNSEFSANRKLTITADGAVVVYVEETVRYVKLTADYTAEILGLWECTGLTGIETFNDANARLEFLSDGTYRYYRKDEGGQWQAVTTREFQDYFVDGTLLATRWKNQGEDELREWWEIESLSGNEMFWTALRQNADGTTVQQKMTWKKIDLKLSEKIIGKWIIADMNGQPAPTNEKLVYTFVSTTKALVSASLNTHPEVSELWATQTENDVAINGNKMTLTSHPNQHETVADELTVTAIDGSELIANRKLTVTVNGKVVIPEDQLVRYEKVTADYREAIVGTWEGRCTSEGSIFDDGKEHRWEYKADGTYVYYVKDGNNWVPYATNTLNEYFVDGTLLCTRWIDNGVENREWWEITIADDKMNWTALRQNEDGTTFTATFEMEKVE
jgi:hypothetical protein